MHGCLDGGGAALACTGASNPFTRLGGVRATFATPGRVVGGRLNTRFNASTSEEESVRGRHLYFSIATSMSERLTSHAFCASDHHVGSASSHFLEDMPVLSPRNGAFARKRFATCSARCRVVHAQGGFGGDVTSPIPVPVSRSRCFPATASCEFTLPSSAIVDASGVLTASPQAGGRFKRMSSARGDVDQSPRTIAPSPAPFATPSVVDVRALFFTLLSSA